MENSIGWRKHKLILFIYVNRYHIERCLRQGPLHCNDPTFHFMNLKFSEKVDAHMLQELRFSVVHFCSKTSALLWYSQAKD